MSPWHAPWRKKKKMWHTVGVPWGQRVVFSKSSRLLTTKSWLTPVQPGTPSATILTPSLPSSSVQVTALSIFPGVLPITLESCKAWVWASFSRAMCPPYARLGPQGPLLPGSPGNRSKPEGWSLVPFLTLTFDSRKYSFPQSSGTPLEGPQFGRCPWNVAKPAQHLGPIFWELSHCLFHFQIAPRASIFIVLDCWVDWLCSFWL